jgi:phage gp29-like protein
MPSQHGGFGSPLIRHPIAQAVLHLLRELILGNGLRLVPRSGFTNAVPEDEQAMLEKLMATTGFETALRHLINAYLEGAAFVEIVWGQDYYPQAFVPLPPESVVVHTDEYGSPVKVQVYTGTGANELPLTHVILFVPTPSFQSPLGSSRLAPYKNLFDTYDETLKALHLYIQRHAVPTVLAQMPSTYTDEEVETVYNALVKMQQAMVAVIPSGTDAKVEFIEPRGTGMELSLRLLETVERIIVRSLLGSILAVYEAQYGTRAQAQVHWEVMQRVVAAMQRPLEQTLHNQLWMPLVRLHKPEVETQLALNEPLTVNRADVLRSLGDLVALGVIDPEKHREWLLSLIGYGL